MNTKEKSKRGKAIIGIAMAAIMLASVFAAMIGSTGAYSVAGKYNIIKLDKAPAQKVLLGQDLEFQVAGGWVPNNLAIHRVVDWAVEDTYLPDHISTSVARYYDIDWTKTGAYYVNFTGNATVHDWSAQLSIVEPKMPLLLKVKEKTVLSLTVGTNLTLDVSGINLFGNDTVDLVVIGPEGRIKTDPINNQLFTNITVANLTKWYGAGPGYLITTGWDLGDYTFQIKTKPEYACGLEKNSAVKELRIAKGEIDITAEKTTVIERESVKLTVTGVVNDTIWINATPSSKHVLFVGGVEDTPTTADERDSFKDKIDEDGKKTYAVEFNDTGSYTIEVTIKGPPIGQDSPRVGDDATVDITVTEKDVVFDVPSTVIIGQKIEIKGTSNTGKRVTIAVDDYVYSKLDRLVLEDGAFEKEIDTATAGIPPFTSPGSVRLKAYIDRDKAASYPEKIGTGETDDGSVAILMSRGDLVAELSAKSVAQDDDFKIEGTAKGTKSVCILIVAPKGSSGTMITGGTGWPTGHSLGGTTIYYGTTSVSETDYKFSKKISVTDDADVGSYLVVVLSPGSDSAYGKTGYDKLVEDNKAKLEAALSQYSLIAKTQDELRAIIEDLITLSDDLIWMGYIKVESPFVTLEPIADVGIGEPLVVNGTTNREEGFAIVVIVKGPKELTPKTVDVTNGTFSATFDTTDVPVGMYTVKADDGDGHIDEVTVNIVTEVAPAPTATPEPTVKPTVAPVPTAEPAAEPTAEPTATPEPPGFEAVFAIAGLLSIAYLVLRRRK